MPSLSWWLASADLAQLVAHRTCNTGVTGSSPVVGSRNTDGISREATTAEMRIARSRIAIVALMANLDSRGMTPEERMNTFLLYPEWFGGDRVPERFVVSADLRKRLREWNRVWETVLDPVTEMRWPDPQIGRAWIAEGEQLVADLQAELGPGLSVVGDFARYAPPRRS